MALQGLATKFSLRGLLIGLAYLIFSTLLDEVDGEMVELLRKLFFKILVYSLL